MPEIENFKPATGETYLDDTINTKFNREISIDPISREFSLHKDDVVRLVKSQIAQDIRSLFRSVSYNKAPKMTKVYKSLLKITNSYYVRDEQHDELVYKMANILNYHHKVITESELNIKHEKNSAHRKNLYQLIVLMEKKYGKKAQ
jgi:hypothetical protein